jgi:selenide,water dikinase
MTIDHARRAEVMRRSQALGHCICDVAKPCPCDVLTGQDRCPCAGERPEPVADAPVALTRHVRNAGCASKIGKAELERLLAGLSEPADPRVLVGRAAGDDAAVVEIAPGVLTVHTVDVFTPPVDDPYAFGRIAAANSVSDIYAMGATPVCALSIIGFPIHELPGQAMREILRGGIDCLAEAGVSVVGGHTLNDPEPKAGFAVTGVCARDAWVRNAGARAGDLLFLSKPLGGGFLAFAHQLGRAPADGLAAWTTAMGTLNRAAALAMTACGASAATDVTGFGLLLHLANLVRGDALVELDVDALPLFPGVEALVRAEVWPGAVERNREAVPATLVDWDGLAPAQRALLLGPETSGGILAAIPAARADEYVRRCADAGVAAVRIGAVVGSHPGGLIRARSAQAVAWATPPRSCCCCR